MPRGLKRCYGQCDLHFVTFCCYHRRRYLESARARNLFVQVLGEVRRKYGFLLVGYVLMPEHVHLLISEPKKSSVSRVLQVLKQRVSRAMRGKRRRASNKQLSLPFGDSLSEDRRFWQRRFYDFNVWSHAKKKEKLQYMHANPVKERLVKHPREWLWSSFSFYAQDQQGLIRIDPVGQFMRRSLQREQSDPPFAKTKPQRVGHPREIQNRLSALRLIHPPGWDLSCYSIQAP